MFADKAIDFYYSYLRYSPLIKWIHNMTASIDFQTLAVNGVLGLHPYQPGKPIEELERELGVSDTLKLASNENPLGASSQALIALQDPLQTLHLYPDGSGFALKNKLATTLTLEPEQITLGNGSNDVLDLIARCFLDNTSNAIFSQHAFAVYHIVTQATGAESRVATAYSADHPSAYGHDLEAMLNLIDAQTRIIFIANPNNPTGTWLKAAELESFLQRVPPETIVVIDEAYFEYVSEEKYPDTTKWLERFHNLIVTRTFSKIYGLAALRVGYCVSHAEIADLLNRVRQPFNVNSLALAAATAALDDREQVVMSSEINRDGLAQWEKACADHDWNYIPSIGNFICVNVGPDAMDVYDALLHKGIIVRPVANYELPHHLRITIGKKEQNQRCIEALEQILND
ncbi:MAG: Histidinol-phosphate aminotransferase [uncultured Thiotrichaceae bacterium]|uniref:Histidinol-phosphate aminotransferase n=1 Tax=uncultured Thiotrichaceae bacterium TaxID=298394 RepID=A0A6S6TSI2_9GAMM|nr:MAG: Histidinol-phosphate aminotransferase [uncultured Thiotrichaceae bacterium]